MSLIFLLLFITQCDKWMYYIRSFFNRPEVLSQFMNPLYEPNNTVLWPSVAPQSLVSYHTKLLSKYQDFYE